MAGQERDYADTLRAVGLFLDEAHGPWRSVDDRGDHWAIRWERAPETRIELSDLQTLRLVARMHRGLAIEQSRFPLCQQLRAVGQLFDQTRAMDVAIEAIPEGFQLSATVVDRRGSRVFTTGQIERLARQQQQDRFA